MIDHSRPLLYVAGPYTNPDPVENTHAACKAAMVIYDETNWCPVVPHLSLLWHAVVPRAYQHWLDYDLHLLRKCDAVVRLPGGSTGADQEIVFARKHGIQIVRFDDLPIGAIKAWESRA